MNFFCVLRAENHEKKQLDDFLKTKGSKVSAVLCFEVPDNEILVRATGRWTHLKSGRTYHMKYKPPKIPGLDDLTGELLVQRDDDKEETVRKRLNFYHKVTEQVLKHYEPQRNLWKINGCLPIDEVWHEVDSIIKAKVFV